MKFARLLLSLLALTPATGATPEVPFYIGTITDRSTSRGIYRCTLNPLTGKLGPVVLAAEAKNPGFLAWSPDRKFLYAVSGVRNTSVEAFACLPDGQLHLLNGQLTGGIDACHLAVDATGHKVAVANYSSSDIACFRLLPDGSIGDRTAFIPFTGKGPNAKRQEKPHPHAVYFAPGNRFLYACDLGTDRVWGFKFDETTGALAATDPAFGATPPGAGPRHLAFGPKNQFVYVANEMGQSVTRFNWDSGTGILSPLDTVPSVPKNLWNETNTTAEIVLHPSGKWLYVSNRGAETIAVFNIAGDGSLSLAQSAPAVALFPRSIAIDPSGECLIASGQKDNRLVVFKIDPATGLLTPTDQIAGVGEPICVLF
jgi:6-phosphogluconolactonase